MLEEEVIENEENMLTAHKIIFRLHVLFADRRNGKLLILLSIISLRSICPDPAYSKDFMKENCLLQECFWIHLRKSIYIEIKQNRWWMRIYWWFKWFSCGREFYFPLKQKFLVWSKSPRIFLVLKGNHEDDEQRNQVNCFLSRNWRASNKLQAIMWFFFAWTNR